MRKVEGFEIYQGSQYNSLDGCEWSRDNDGEVKGLSQSASLDNYLLKRGKGRLLRDHLDWRSSGRLGVSKCEKIRCLVWNIRDACVSVCFGSTTQEKVCNSNIQELFALIVFGFLKSMYTLKLRTQVLESLHYGFTICYYPLHTIVANIDKKMCKITSMILSTEKEHNCALSLSSKMLKANLFSTHFIKDFI